TFSICVMAGSFSSFAAIPPACPAGVARKHHFPCRQRRMSLSLYNVTNYVDLLCPFIITRFRKLTISRVVITKTRRPTAMTAEHTAEPLFPNPKRLLLDMAQEQSLAELLGLKPTTLASRIKSLGILPPNPRQ